MLTSFLDCRQGAHGAALAEVETRLDVGRIAQKQGHVIVNGSGAILPHVVRRVFVAIDRHLERRLIKLLERCRYHTAPLRVEADALFRIGRAPMFKNPLNRTY